MSSNKVIIRGGEKEGKVQIFAADAVDGNTEEKAKNVLVKTVELAYAFKDAGFDINTLEITCEHPGNAEDKIKTDPE